MIGNDVVDLADREALPGSSHPRFDARVFDPSELALLRRSAAPARLRWALWAAKEAAYKAAERMDPGTVFSPRRFVVIRGGGASSLMVLHGERRFTVALGVGAGWVHAVATPDGAPRPGALLQAVEALEAWEAASPHAASLAVRRMALEAVARAAGLAVDRLGVIREGRLPRLLYGSRVVPAELSLSHHGRFAAFACLLRAPLGRGV